MKNIFKIGNVDEINLAGVEKVRKSWPSEDLIKAGEGSRGGKIIGHTKSGKPIYASANHPSHSNFSSEDHHDAKVLHNSLGQKKQQSLKDKYGVDHGKAVTSYRKEKITDILKQKLKGKHIASQKENINHHEKQSDIHGSKIKRKEKPSKPSKPVSKEDNVHKRAGKHWIENSKFIRSELDELVDLIKGK